MAKNKKAKKQQTYQSFFNKKKSNHKILDSYDNTKVSLLLLSQSALDTITKICQPVAQSSEFQIHYRALVIRIKNDINELVVTIPTAFYNFKQRVSTTSVHYHLLDIDSIATSLQDTSHSKCAELLKLPLFQALQTLEFDIDIYESNCGSIHRHPGRFGFSSIDLNQDPSDPGVVYRNKNAYNFAQTDSIIYINAKNETELFLSESRIVNVVTENDFTSGTYTEIPTLTALLQNNSDTNSFTELLGRPLSLTDEQYKFIGDTSFIKYFLIQEILQAFAQTAYEPDISSVLSKHISHHVPHIRTYPFDTNTSKDKTSKYHQRIWGDYEQSLLDDPFYYNDFFY